MEPKAGKRDARASQRRGVAMTAHLRGHGTFHFDVEVLDLSTTGFRCETYFGLVPGSRVLLTIPTLGALAATVTWQSQYVYGCKFEQPLHPAVWETIVARYPDTDKRKR